MSMRLNCVLCSLYLTRYMHDRVCSKPDENSSTDPLEMPIPSSSGGRTRRTGLLTVMERPPGKNQAFIHLFALIIAAVRELYAQRPVFEVTIILRASTQNLQRCYNSHWNKYTHHWAMVFVLWSSQSYEKVLSKQHRSTHAVDVGWTHNSVSFVTLGRHSFCMLKIPFFFCQNHTKIQSFRFILQQQNLLLMNETNWKY